MEHWINGKQKAAVLEESEFRRESFQDYVHSRGRGVQFGDSGPTFETVHFFGASLQKIDMPLQYLIKVHIPLYRP